MSSTPAIELQAAAKVAYSVVNGCYGVQAEGLRQTVVRD